MRDIKGFELNYQPIYSFSTLSSRGWLLLGLLVILLLWWIVSLHVFAKCLAADHSPPDSFMSEVQRVRLSRKSCMMRVESLGDR